MRRAAADENARWNILKRFFEFSSGRVSPRRANASAATRSTIFTRGHSEVFGPIAEITRWYLLRDDADRPAAVTDQKLADRVARASFAGP